MSAAACLELGADNWCMLHFPGLAGVAYKAPDVSRAMEMAPVRLAGEADWLVAHGLAVPEWVAGLTQHGASEPAAMAVGETVRTAASCADGDTEAFFGAFAQPLTAEQCAVGLSYLAAARADLLEIVLQHGTDWLDREPVQGGRTPRKVLHHLADAELFYLVRLEPTPERAAALWETAAAKRSSELERMATIRDLLVERLQTLDEPGRARITVHHPHAERWTAAKVLYRAIWHQRHHARALAPE